MSKLRNGKLHKLYVSPGVIKELIPKRTRWVEHEASIGKANGRKISVRKPEGKSQLRRPRSRWGTVLRWILEKLDRFVCTAFVWPRA